MSCVDVVIPCYKYAHYLRGCVKSVLDQQGVDVRVLIIDDCSPDNTPEVASQIVAEDSRVEYRRHTVNAGHIDTYNEGLIGWATSEYCLLLSADDLLMPDALRRATRLMDADSAISMTYGRAIHTPDPSREEQQSVEGDGSRVLSGSQFIRISCEEATNLVPTPCAIVRTRCQHQVGGYRKSLPHSGDMEMWLRLAAVGSIGVVDAELAFYRVHAAAMSTGYEGTRDLLAKKAALVSVFVEYGDKIENATEMQQLAMRVLADRAFQSAGNLFEAGKPAAQVNEYLEAARQILPEIVTTRDWSRFALRRRIGRKAWNMLSGASKLLRGRTTGVTSPAPVAADWLRRPWIQSQRCG